MTLRIRAWRKHKRELDLFLRYSDDEDEHRGIENNCHCVPGSPEDDWMTFPLIKIKITSAKRHECESYNLTSQAEDNEENQDWATGSKRSRTKKGMPEGFVRSGPFLILTHYTTYTFVL
ncbi:hypothetical protein CHARACLAT_027403 [Characodon lateralis]|uniref:Uncharacterized protein n=1 Tax=Characodon lateralis TaxID=208331 RepID=A0ABU7F8K6_9TELE|nr:hypothetical protein [Characodon lateralis]